MFPDNYASVPNNYFAAPSTAVSSNSRFTLLTTSNKWCLIWCLSISSISNCSNEHFQYCGYYSKYRALGVKYITLLCRSKACMSLNSIFKSWDWNQVFQIPSTSKGAPNKMTFGMLLCVMAIEATVTHGFWVPRVSKNVQEGKENNEVLKTKQNKKISKIKIKINCKFMAACSTQIAFVKQCFHL